MSSIVNFVARDRDAWATIRGYVYQVDHTIERWISLGPDEILELESGEDIDCLKPLLTIEVPGSATEQTRLLEQIKHRAGRLSLHSEAALAALANAFDHCEKNPTLQLLFRFTTNADAVREQGSALSPGISGLDAWNALRAATDPREHAQVLAALRLLITRGTVPAGIRKADWSRFQDFVATSGDDDFLRFVRRFEWATRAIDAKSLRPHIEAELRNRGHIADSGRAGDAYRSLFVAVFHRLSESGTKRLDGEGLRTALSLSSYSTGDATVRALVLELTNAIAERVDALEESVSEVKSALVVANERIAELASRAGIVATVDPASLPAPIGEPAPISFASDRAATVDAICSGNEVAILALHGAAASGKTQLALRLAERLVGQGTDSIRWVRFAGLGASHAGVRLAQAIASRALNSLVESTSSLRVVVFDDVPPFRDGDELGVRLLPLVRSIIKAGNRVVFTSELPLAALEVAYGPNAMRTLGSPPFSADETADVLRAYGAPTAILSGKVVDFLTNIATGHPVLLHAIARFLAARNWSLGGATMIELLANKFAEPVNQETVRTLLADVSDQATRDLLYRLTLLHGVFGWDDVEALGCVGPEIPARRERFATLLGPWIQPEAEGRFELSPLVRKLGATDLEASTRAGCHGAIARRIASRAQINDMEASQAIMHFAAAGEGDSAGVLLIQALNAAVESAWTSHEPLFAMIWHEMPLPESVPQWVAVQVRAHQVRYATSRGKSAEYPSNELLRMLRMPSAESWSEFAAAATAAMALGGTDSRAAIALMGHALRLWPQASSAFMERLAESRAPRILGPEILLWLSARAVKDESSYDEWVAELETLPESVVRASLAGAFAVQGAHAIASCIVDWTYEKPEHARDWSSLVARLNHLERVAAEKGAPALWMRARAALIAAVGDGMRDRDAALSLAKDVFANATGAGLDADTRLVVADAAGLMLIDANLFDAAAEWFRRASEAPTRWNERTRVRTKLRLAQCVGEREPAAALVELEGAVRLADELRPEPLFVALSEFDASAVDNDRRSDRSDRAGQTQRLEVPIAQVESVRARAYGELAIGRLLIDDVDGAAHAALAMLEHALQSRVDEDDDAWKRLMLACGHLSGYIYMVVKTGGPPSANGEEFAKPWRSMILSPRPGTESLFQPAKLTYALVHAMQLARSIGEYHRAAQWAAESLRIFKENEQWFAATVPAEVVVEASILDGDYATAIETAIDTAAALRIAVSGIAAADDISLASERPRTILDRQDIASSAADWAEADAVVFADAVLPAFVHACMSRVTQNDDRSLGLRVVEALERVAADVAKRPGVHSESGTDAVHSQTADDHADVWAAAATLCRSVFADGAEASELLGLVERYDARSRTEAWRTLVVLAYLGASVQARTPLRQSAELQANVAQFIQVTVGRRMTGLYERLVVDFFSTFWEHAFDAARFQFTTPRLMETALRSATASSPDVRVQRVLSTVTQSLGVSLPPRGRAWFDLAKVST